jgi:IS30 family transposase
VKKRSEIEISRALNISASTVNRIVLELQREEKPEGKYQYFSRLPRE